MWSFFECLLHDGMATAVSSANVRIVASRRRWFMMRRRLSVAIANISGDNGQPCLIPRVVVKGENCCPCSRRWSVLLLWKLFMVVIASIGAPNAASAWVAYSREIEGKAAVKSYNIRVGSASSPRASMCAMWSISTTFASIERPGRKPLW